MAKNETRLQYLNVDDIVQGIRMIRNAKQGHPEYRFNPVNAKRFETGTGVDFDTLLQRCPEITQELFHLMVVEEGLAQHFRILDVNANGSGALQVEIPSLNDSEGSSYLQSGIGCEYSPTGESVLGKRTMDVNPWHYYREYCPKEWGNSFRGQAYVNDEQLPMEAVVLEFLFSKILNAWEHAVLAGNLSTSDSPFDGLITQIAADTTIPGAQVVAGLNPSTNAVQAFEDFMANVPAHMYRNAQQEPLIWLTPSQHLEYYVRNYRERFDSLPYNNRFDKFGPDSMMVQANFVATSHLTNEHIITSPANLFLGVANNMDIKVGFSDSGRSQVLFVRVEGHTGVGYANSNNIVVANVH